MSGRMSRAPSAPRAILFDAADTLFELAEPVARVYARVFGRSGHRVEEVRVREVFGEVFRARPDPDYRGQEDGDVAERDWWRSVVLETAGRCGVPTAGEVFESIFAELFAHYAQGAAYRVFPEALEVLGELKDAGFLLGVVSNFDRRLHRIMAELALDGWFSVIVSSADARSRKPDPGIFLHALDAIGCVPEEVAHIGDSEEADFMGADRAGMRAFLVDRPRLDLFDALEWIRGGSGGK